ncbi:MAG TPA: YciI family protein [Candidatus Saccharimonadales bacterium]|nr:YciI family protein [Candidatus Saccharimonadales bacterium]
MAKFILLYKGPATPMDQITKEDGEKIMTGWKAWMDKMGAALVDVGQPMANGKSVVDDGSAGTPTDLNGYSIVEAGSIDEATQLVQDHPFLSDKTGKFSVEVFELMPMPM